MNTRKDEDVSDQEILRRLDLIQATLALGFSKEIREAADEILGDPVNAAVVKATDDWIASTELQDVVAGETSMSKRLVRDRLPELVDRRVLETRGSERRLEYRRTGLV